MLLRVRARNICRAMATAEFRGYLACYEIHRYLQSLTAVRGKGAHDCRTLADVSVYILCVDLIVIRPARQTSRHLRHAGDRWRRERVSYVRVICSFDCRGSDCYVGRVRSAR